MPATLTTPPNLTTTERDALTSPQAGWCIYNTTLQSYEIYMNGAWKTINQPEFVADSYLNQALSAYSSVVKTVSLSKAGFTLGFAILTGKITAGSGYGKRGCGVMLKPRTTAAQYAAVLDILEYPSVVSYQLGGGFTSKASSPSFDTTGYIYLKAAYLNSDGGSAAFEFYNSASSSKNVDAYIDLFVW